MAELISAGTRPARRWAAWLGPRLLVLAALALLPAPAPQPLHAQAKPNIAELRMAIAVRDAQGAGAPDAVVAAAQAYLSEFPEGRYADEVLLALAQGYAGQEHPELALQAYNRIVKEFPDSPFREQALTESLPLLQAQGDQAGAFARVDTLVEAYPNSLQRSAALLWKAGAQSEQADAAGALATLKRIDPQQDLADSQEAEYYRLQTLALVRSGESAWTPLQRYLKRDDTPEHKAEVLLLVGEVARKGGRPDEALRFYRQVVEDYPVPGAVNEALYWRAELFAQTRLENAPEAVRGARRETAIGYYSGYLETDDPAHRAKALIGRGALLRDAGRFDPALADYEAAVKLDETLLSDPKVVRARVDLLQKAGRPKEAVALLEAIRADAKLSDDERTAFQVQQAALHYEAEQCEQVEALLNPMPIIADVKLRSRAFFMRGFCRYRQEQWEKATFDLEGLVNDPAYQELALPPLLEAYEKSGQASRLVNLAEELLRAGRVKPTPELMTRLANGYDKLGEPALMLSAFERLEKTDPDAVRTPAIQLRMGLARERLGQRDAAAVHYRAVLDATPADPPPDAEGEATYLTALEHLQALLADAGKVDELPPLHEAAAAVVQSDEGKARLTALRRDVDVALARSELQNGDAPAAAKRLEGVLQKTPVVAGERRAKVAALLMTAYARGDAPDKAAALYGDERTAHEADGYRATLATQVLAAVQTPAEAPKEAPQRKALIALYRQALDDLPPDQRHERQAAAKRLDALYRADGDHAARAALVTLLLKDGLDDEAKHELRLYQGEIYKEWGRSLLEKDDLKGAEFQLRRGLELAQEGDWRERYALTSLLSQVQLKRKEYTDLVLRNEDMLPEVEQEDPALAAQVRHYLGQVYVQWGKEAADADNAKSARIRYGYALDYLPASDWQRRLAATNGLSKILQQQGQPEEAAAAYEAVLPQVDDPAVKQQYALYLGRLYAERVKDPARALRWFGEADQGDGKPLSLEAGYLWADQQVAAEHPGAALERLEALAGRGIGGTQWEVPILYRIAVIYHGRKDYRKALEHYRIVAATKNADARRLYPRSIEQSSEQARKIEAYLKNSGGRRSDIAVPQVKSE